MMKLGAALLAAAVLAAPAPAQTLRLEASEPRAFGYQVGDVVQRQVVVHAPDGWTLDDSSLPKAGRRGQPIELQRVTANVQREDGGHRHELRLDYQVFLAPTVVRTLEIPSFRLQFTGAARREELLVEAWPLTVAPLVPLEVSPRRGLGELQPDLPPPHLDTTAPRQRLLVMAAVALLLLGVLAWTEFGPLWRAARQRPFGIAWRRLRRLTADPTQDDWRSACRQFHDALNRSFGEVLFEPGLDRFVAALPRFAPQRDAIARFLQLSRQEFFGQPARQAGDAAWLVALCRQLRDAERSQR